MRFEAKKHGVEPANFVTNIATAKSPIQSLIASLCRSVNQNKISYDQLRFVFKSVRTKCELGAPKKRRSLYQLPTDAELGQFYAGIANPVHRLAFEFLEGTGLRVAELCNLEVGHIDFKNNTIFVKEGKGKRDRVTVIGSRLRDKLQLYLDGRNNRHLFESNRHSRFTTRRIEQLCQKYRKQAGILNELTPHTFRHLWNTRLAEGGISREGREILAGHAKGSATQDIYTHLGVDGIKDSVIALLDRHSFK